MQDDHLPIDPDRDKRLPVRAAGVGGMPEARAHALALDLREVAAGDPDEIDLLAYWRILVKRRWQVLGLLAAVVALALLHTLMTPPTYRATVVMQISNQEQQVVPIGGMGAGMGGRWDPEFMQTQLELLKSRSLSERVAEDLDLDRAALDGLYQPSWLEQVKGLLRPAPKASAEQNVTAAESAALLGSVTDEVRDGLSVEPILQSRLVQVNFDSQVPAFSARVANAIAEGFIAADLDRRVGANSYAKEFLEDQLRQTKSRLEDSERKLVAFAQKENLVSSAEGESLAGQNLGDLNSALATAQEQRIRAQARWSQAQTASGAALPADMLSNSIIRTLQQQRAQLQGTYQQKLQVFKADYPEMLQLKGQLDELDKQITGELRNIRASVKAEYDAAASQERLLLGQLSALRTQALDVDSRSIDYNIIKREVDTNRQLYDSLLQRYKEVGVTGDVRTNNISVIDRAEVPEGRFAPSVSRNLAIGLALGLLLGVLLAFLLEFLDDTLKTPEDIEQRLKLAVLGIIPKLKKQQPADALHDPRSAFSEAYRSVRTALQFSTHDGVPRVLLVTSPGPGEGKSTTALMLARNFAQLGKRVLLVEADLRNPSLHKTLGLRAEAGLSNLLAGAVSLDGVVLGTDNVRLKVILAGPLPPNPAELLSGSRLISLLSVAAENYDQIIIDGPPIMGIADAPILANAVGATLIVIHSGRTRISTAQAALKRLLSVRAHVIGALITQYDTKAAGYGYSYEGYYAYGGTPRLTRK